jgi:hypothetical protein
MMQRIAKSQCSHKLEQTRPRQAFGSCSLSIQTVVVDPHKFT